MKDYSKYSSVDFANDESFFTWVKLGAANVEVDEFWRYFLASNPDKQGEIVEAKRIVMSVLTESEHYPGLEKEREIWNRLQRSINSEISNSKKEEARTRKFFLTSRQIAAAVAIVLFTSAATFWLTRTGDNSLAGRVEGWKTEANISNVAKTVFLSDGSSVVLQPGSTLHYADKFESDIRKVELEGEAFFQVAKDPNRPFLVYTEKIITKVLGTSFTVRAFREEKEIKVQVRTGKVSVFTNDEKATSQNVMDKQLQGVLLTPNQQAVFSKDESVFVKSLIEDPQVLQSLKSSQFEFSDTPLREVFASLQKAYGVEIIFDDELIGNCALNASLDGMPLFDKMRLICKGVNANFEIIDSRIVVTGKGCD